MNVYECIYLNKSLIIAYASGRKRTTKAHFQAAKIVRLDVKILQRERKGFVLLVKNTLSYHRRPSPEMVGEGVST